MFNLTYVGKDPVDPNFVLYNLTGEPEEIRALEKQAMDNGFSLNDYVVALIEKAVRPENREELEKLIHDNSDGPELCG